VAPVTHGEIAEPSIHDEVDEHRNGKDAVGNQIEAEPVEASADDGADDDDGEPDARIEVLADIEIPAFADGTAIDCAISPERIAEGERDFAAAASADDG
jgi:hypothetical protein